jgi:mRNA interferase RelE/StbE
LRYTIIWSPQAERTLRKLERSVAKRIFEAVSKLESNPHRRLRKLVNSPWYRMRVGDYRVIVGIEGERLTILVLRVDKREVAYRK